MSLDKRDSIGDFINEATEIYSEQRQGMSEYMVQRVARHFILTSRKIGTKEIQKLNNKLWNDK